MVNYQEQLLKAFTNWHKLGIGVLVSIIPVISLFGAGYALACARNTKKQLPEWKDWWQLFVDGLLSVLLSIIYLLPALLIAGIALAPTLIESFNRGVPPLLFSSNLAAASGAFVIFFLLGWYVLPLALVRFAKTKSFSKGLDVGFIFSVAFGRAYPVTWFVVLLFQLASFSILDIVNSALSFVIVLPVLTSAFVNFVVSVGTMSAMGELYSEL